ncbi:hypothetical protein PVAR5_6618 [Paecilomyces variotii No. 5]|uniref:Uncharacterized protein n=1 Tax=Byssochlamys spectabilis (strain No. 5 / NBRC 109023) TaxID=1356009 RepID=V5GAJ6_BYSSN|nr:hypothetical protein PVAR5_6618 [Paecilomyces variotii No. 5]
MEERQEDDEFTQESAHKERELKPSREKMGVVCALGDGRWEALVQRRGQNPPGKVTKARPGTRAPRNKARNAQMGTNPAKRRSSIQPQNGFRNASVGSGFWCVCDDLGLWREI